MIGLQRYFLSRRHRTPKIRKTLRNLTATASPLFTPPKPPFRCDNFAHYSFRATLIAASTIFTAHHCSLLRTCTIGIWHYNQAIIYSARLDQDRDLTCKERFIPHFTRDLNIWWVRSRMSHITGSESYCANSLDSADLIQMHHYP